MTKEEFEQWKNESLNRFEVLYEELSQDLKENGKITKRSKLTSLLYLFQNCNYDAGDIIYQNILNDATEDNALAHYLLGHIYMYGYRGIMGGNKDLEIAREYFETAHTINPNFTNKQNP